MSDQKAITLEEAVDQIASLFDDGFQWKDLWDAIPMVMELVEDFEGLDGAAKKERALKIIDKLLDKIDLPGPDWISKKIILYFIPDMIDKLIDAAKGKFNF